MNELDLGLNDPLAMTNEEVSRLTRPQREARVVALVAQSRDFLSAAIEEHVTNDERMVAAVVVLFSGGNDSTTLAHLFRHDVDYAAHANTGIGIEQTRVFVRNTCEEWGIQLIERRAPRAADHYRNLVLEGGFPGPAMHFKMFTRLKERALVQVQRELVTNPRKERVVFIAGRRRDESKRRANVPLSERVGSRVYVSPLINWTKSDLNAYRLMQGDVPVNEVSDLIHMSGECLCGAFASPGERDEIDYWFPLALEEVRELELALVAKNAQHRAEVLSDARRLLKMGPIWRDDHAAHARLLDLIALRRRQAQEPLIPVHRTTWGWGADSAKKALDGPPSKPGVMCSSCDDRFQRAFDLGAIA